MKERGKEREIERGKRKGERNEGAIDDAVFRSPTKRRSKLVGARGKVYLRKESFV